jgi:hypothetical protein
MSIYCHYLGKVNHRRRILCHLRPHQNILPRSVPCPAPLPRHHSYILFSEPRGHQEYSFRTLYHCHLHSLLNLSLNLNRRLDSVHEHHERDQSVSC